MAEAPEYYFEDTYDIILSYIRMGLYESGRFTIDEIYEGLPIDHSDFANTELLDALRRIGLHIEGRTGRTIRTVMEERCQELATLLLEETGTDRAHQAYFRIMKVWLLYRANKISWDKVVMAIHFASRMVDGSVLQGLYIPMENIRFLAWLCTEFVQTQMGQFIFRRSWDSLITEESSLLHMIYFDIPESSFLQTTFSTTSLRNQANATEPLSSQREQYFTNDSGCESLQAESVEKQKKATRTHQREESPHSYRSTSSFEEPKSLNASPQAVLKKRLPRDLQPYFSDFSGNLSPYPSEAPTKSSRPQSLQQIAKDSKKSPSISMNSDQRPSFAQRIPAENKERRFSADDKRNSSILRHLPTPRQFQSADAAMTLQGQQLKEVPERSEIGPTIEELKKSACCQKTRVCLQKKSVDKLAKPSSEKSEANSLAPTTADLKAKFQLNEETHNVIMTFLKENISARINSENGMEFFQKHIDGLFALKGEPGNGNEAAQTLIELAQTVVPAVMKNYHSLLEEVQSRIASIVDVKTKACDAGSELGEILIGWLVADEHPLTFDRIIMALELTSELMYQIFKSCGEAGIQRVTEIIDTVQRFFHVFSAEFQDLGGWSCLVNLKDELKRTAELNVPAKLSALSLKKETGSEREEFQIPEETHWQIWMDMVKNFYNKSSFDLSPEAISKYNVCLANLEKIKADVKRDMKEKERLLTEMNKTLAELKQKDLLTRE